MNQVRLCWSPLYALGRTMITLKKEGFITCCPLRIQTIFKMSKAHIHVRNVEMEE